MNFGIKKIYNFDPFWAIATKIPQQLKTGLVLQGHNPSAVCISGALLETNGKVWFCTQTKSY